MVKDYLMLTHRYFVSLEGAPFKLQGISVRSLKYVDR